MNLYKTLGYTEVELKMLSYYGTGSPPPTPAPLSREEEQAAFLRYHKRRNAKDRELLLRKYLCWAFNMAARYKGPRLDFDEAISSANEGLVEALEKFDPTLGFRFTTFAAWTLRRKLIAAIVNTYPVKVRDHTRQKLRLLDREAEKVLGTEPTQFDDFFARLGETSDVDISRLHEQPEDAPFVPSSVPSPAEAADKGSRREEILRQVGTLPWAERVIILGRFFSDPPVSYDILTAKLGIRKSRAKEIYEKALVLLRDKLQPGQEEQTD